MEILLLSGMHATDGMQFLSRLGAACALAYLLLVLVVYAPLGYLHQLVIFELALVFRRNLLRGVEIQFIQNWSLDQIHMDVPSSSLLIQLLRKGKYSSAQIMFFHEGLFRYYGSLAELRAEALLPGWWLWYSLVIWVRVEHLDVNSDLLFLLRFLQNVPWVLNFFLSAVIWLCFYFLWDLLWRFLGGLAKCYKVKIHFVPHWVVRGRIDRAKEQLRRVVGNLPSPVGKSDPEVLR